MVKMVSGPGPGCWSGKLDAVTESELGVAVILPGWVFAAGLVPLLCVETLEVA